MNSAMKSPRLNAVKVRSAIQRCSPGAVSSTAVCARPHCLSARFPLALLGAYFRVGVFLSATFALLLVVTNEILLGLISRRRGQRLGLITPVYIAFLTIVVVLDFRLLVSAADVQVPLLFFFLEPPAGFGMGNQFRGTAHLHPPRHGVGNLSAVPAGAGDPELRVRRKPRRA